MVSSKTKKLLTALKEAVANNSNTNHTFSLLFDSLFLREPEDALDYGVRIRILTNPHFYDGRDYQPRRFRLLYSGNDGYTSAQPSKFFDDDIPPSYFTCNSVAPQTIGAFFITSGALNLDEIRRFIDINTDATPIDQRVARLLEHQGPCEVMMQGLMGALRGDAALGKIVHDNQTGGMAPVVKSVSCPRDIYRAILRAKVMEHRAFILTNDDAGIDSYIALSGRNSGNLIALAMASEDKVLRTKHVTFSSTGDEESGSNRLPTNTIFKI